MEEEVISSEIEAAGVTTDTNPSLKAVSVAHALETIKIPKSLSNINETNEKITNVKFVKLSHTFNVLHVTDTYIMLPPIPEITLYGSSYNALDRDICNYLTILYNKYNLTNGNHLINYTVSLEKSYTSLCLIIDNSTFIPDLTMNLIDVNIHPKCLEIDAKIIHRNLSEFFNLSLKMPKMKNGWYEQHLCDHLNYQLRLKRDLDRMYRDYENGITQYI